MEACSFASAMPMIRYNMSIRLSGVDLALFASLTGADLPPPTDVADYNQRLRLAASTWAQGSSEEERLLVDIAHGLLLDEDDACSVIDQDKLTAGQPH
jgi:hypothetical protein